MAGWCMRGRSAAAAQLASHHLEVADELFRRQCPCFGVRCAKDRRWVNGRHDDVGVLRLDRLPSILRDTERLAEQCLGRGGAEADDDFRLDEGDLELEPGVAGGDLGGGGLLVSAPRAPTGPCALDSLATRRPS